MISQKKRSMSILVGHSGLSARLTRIAATDVLCRWLLTTKRGGLHQNRQTYSFEHRGSRQSTWVWRRDTRENMSTFQGCFEISLEGTEVYAYALRSTSSQAGAMRTRFPLLFLPFFPSCPTRRHTCLVQPAGSRNPSLETRITCNHVKGKSVLLSHLARTRTEQPTTCPGLQMASPVYQSQSVRLSHLITELRHRTQHLRSFTLETTDWNRLDMTWPGHSTLRL